MTEVEYVTHASLSVRRAGCCLLLDPFYFLDEPLSRTMCHFPARNFETVEFGQIDYVFSSHIHPDHSHPLTLTRLKPQIRHVLLPAERPELQARYRSLGFDDITLLENGETFALRDDLEVTAFWSDPVDCALVVRAGDHVILHQNDCQLTPPVLEAIGQRFSVDYAFLCYTAAQDLFPLLLDRPASELERLARAREEERFRHNLACIAAWKPSHVVPYSMTMTYFQPDQIHLNGYGRFVPNLFCERVRAARPGVRADSMQPGDVIELDSGRIRQAAKGDAWGANLDEYLANIRQFAAEHRHQLPAFDPGSPRAVTGELFEYLRGRLKAPFQRGVAKGMVCLHVTGATAQDRVTFLLNLKAGTVVRGSPAWLTGPRPWLSVSVPATIVQLLLEHSYDPFSALYSYRVGFQLDAEHRRSPREDTELLVSFFVDLFAPALVNGVL